MVFVLALWYILKHLLARSRQDPLLRGTYEHMFHDLSVEHPMLWSRNGPRDYIEAKGRVNAWKWYFLKKWFAPSKTIAAKGYDQDVDGLGVWARFKRYLAMRWLPQIEIANPTKADGEDGTELSETLYNESSAALPFDVIRDGLNIVNRVGIAEAEPTIAMDPRLSPPPSRASRSRARRSPRLSGDASERPQSQSSGSCMVTEEPVGNEGDESDVGSTGDGQERPRSAPEVKTGQRGRGVRGLGLLEVPIGGGAIAM